LKKKLEDLHRKVKDLETSDAASVENLAEADIAADINDAILSTLTTMKPVTKQNTFYNK
jgi:hypothetical protein